MHVYAKDILKVGVTPGPHLEIMEFLQKSADEYDLSLKIVEFTDYMIPNIALAEGDIDINSFQHLLFLEEQIAKEGYKIESVSKSILVPMLMCSYLHKNLDSLKKKEKEVIIAIPSDPTNNFRALAMLEKMGLISIIHGKDDPFMNFVPSIALKIVEVDAAQLPRLLDEVDAVLMNGDWAITVNLPESFVIAREAIDYDYANLLVIRSRDKNSDKINQFLSLYNSYKAKSFIQKKFGSFVIPLW